MTLNLSEMKDEPLGKQPILEALGGWRPTCYGPTPDQTEQQVAAAADGEGVFKIDVDCLSDEALDTPPVCLMRTAYCGAPPTHCKSSSHELVDAQGGARSGSETKPHLMHR